jgi:regulator of protease activity HflC (stomatin/prohibitin superfamily)
MKRVLGRIGEGVRRVGYLGKAMVLAVFLGLLETVGSGKGRRILALLVLVGVGVGVWATKPFRTLAPGEMGVRVNKLTGSVSTLNEGWVLVVPFVQELRVYPLRDQLYRPENSSRANGSSPFQSVEGLTLGVDVMVRYALDPERVGEVALSLPPDLGRGLVEPVVDGVMHRVFARHTVREIFSSKRVEIEQEIVAELAPLLKRDGVAVRGVYLGNVDLPEQYRNGLDALLSEELAAEKMRYTLELKAQHVKQSELEGAAEKVRREKAAEAAGEEEIIAAKARAEAMKHVLPLKEKEIEQKRLEAEAARVSRLKGAEAEADARRIEASGEADARKKLAESDAYRMEVTGKAATEQLARESKLIKENPLLIQKTVADKLSDKIQVIVAPPSTSGFFASGLLGQTPARAAADSEEEE